MVLADLLVKLGFSVDESPLHRVEHSLESLEQKVAFIGGAEIVKGIFELAERFAGMGEHLESAALQAGITTEEFQRLAFAASQNALGQEELSGGLARMTRLLAKAKEGGKGATEQFAKLGITADQVSGFKNSEDALLAVSDAIKGIDDPIKRVAAAQAIFGRGAANMVKFLKQGSGGIKELGAQADGMGAVLSGEGVESLANFEDAMSGLMQVVKTFGATIGATFAPVFTAIIHDIEHLWGANQKLIQSNLKAWAKEAAFAIGFVTEALRLAATAIFNFIAAHPKLVAGMAAVLAILIPLSLSIGALKWLLGDLVGLYHNVAGVASLAGMAMSGALALATRATAIFLPLLGALLERIGYAVYTLFPGLGNAIFKLGGALTALGANPAFLTVAAVVGSVVALGLAIQAIWAMLHGKSFWDTWLGEGLNAIIKYGKEAYGLVGRIFGGKDDTAGAADAGGPDGGIPEFARRAGPSLLEQGDGSGALLQRAAAKLSLGSIPSLGTGALQALGPGGMVGSLGGAAPMAAAAADAAPITVNSPITINVSGNADAQAIGHEVRKAHQQVWGEVMRATHRDMTAPAAQ